MEYKSFSEAIADLAVVSRQCVYRRIRDGWTTEDALSLPRLCRRGAGTKILVVGDRLGMLTLLRQEKSLIYKRKVWQAMWTCMCLCGSVVVVRSQHLRSGRTRSCGCLRKLRVIEFNTRTKKGVRRGVSKEK